MKTVECGARIDGPRIGARVVAWRKYCLRKVRVPDDVPEWRVHCHLHRGPTDWQPSQQDQQPRDREG